METEMREDTDTRLCFLFYLPIYPVGRKKQKQSARVKKRQPKHTVIQERTLMQTIRLEEFRSDKSKPTERSD